MKVRKAFNDSASSYDQDFTHTNIGRVQRKQVWRMLDPWLRPGMEVLELNCGTGEDALELARRGLKVTATDISDNMIEIARAKKSQAAEGLDVQFHRMGFAELKPEMINQRFDLVFSNFGGLNCLSPGATRQLALHLTEIVKPSGMLFLVYMSKDCLWEKVYYFWKGEFEKGRRRSHPMPVKVAFGKEIIDVWYAQHRAIAKTYETHFTLIASCPVGLFVPPSYLEAFFAGKKNLLRLLELMDRFFSRSLFTDYADHQVLIFKRTT